VIRAKVRGLARGTRPAISSERRGRALKSSGYQRPRLLLVLVWVHLSAASISAAVGSDVSRSYRALIQHSMSPSGGTLLHLIREDAEASLCGIPRAQLSAGGFDQLVCPECIEWLPKRVQFSQVHPKVQKP
jgi:hypothetical protein